MKLLKELNSKNLINPPPFLLDNCHYVVIMGSYAYGVSEDNSDEDIYGFCMPTKDMIFPHLKGHILGFGTNPPKFEQWQQHHIEGDRKCYDFSIFNIVKYFQLCMQNNPNMIDSLFVPRRCVKHVTKVGEMVREKRKDFLHKGAWHRFKGYAYSQMHKMDIKNPKGKRKELIEKYGYDVKFAYHVVRLLNEVEQILIENDLTLDKNREQLKAIRRGEWSQDQIKEYFHDKEKSLEDLYISSKLPHSPDENKIKALLINCLEEHYGNLEKCVANVSKYEQAIEQIKNIVHAIR